LVSTEGIRTGGGEKREIRPVFSRTYPKKGRHKKRWGTTGGEKTSARESYLDRREDFAIRKEDLNLILLQIEGTTPCPKRREWGTKKKRLIYRGLVLR